jgi:hypothetical protein
LGCAAVLLAVAALISRAHTWTSQDQPKGHDEGL